MQLLGSPETIGLSDWVCGDTALAVNDHAVRAHSVVDELRIFGRPTVEAFLDHMVTVETLDQLHGMILQSLDDSLRLLRGRDALNHLLQCTCTMLVRRNGHKLGSDAVDQSCALLNVGILEQFLAEVVSEGIGHQLDYMHTGFLEYHLNMLREALLQLSLQISATVLVLAQIVQFNWELVGTKNDHNLAIIVSLWGFRAPPARQLPQHSRETLQLENLALPPAAGSTGTV